ncbi:anti-sigma-D factor RsdA [Gordonia caeni]|uniref:Anti-sigma-D factor RsdA sigma factor binding region domain-containing protein n=1 Tax=Gordonia caeni TaxID=1007097 RepID=A0ABP7PI67_9ACTN
MKDHGENSVDLQAVRRDDEFLDALAAGGGLPPADEGEAAVGSLLFAWRTEALAPPPPVHPTLADVDAALAAQAAERKRQGFTRHLRLISGAAAITAVAAAGLLVLSENSEPGDPLWNVKKVVFAEQAQQTQATINVQNHLERAEAARAAGDTVAVASLVEQAEHELRPINEGATRERMEQWIQRLRDDDDKRTETDKRLMTGTSESSTDPATPPSDITSDSSTSSSVTVTVPSSETPSSSSSAPSSSPSQPSSSEPSTSRPTSSSQASRTVTVSPTPSR